MKKIISLYQRNYDGDRLVRNEVTPGADWVLAGEGVATRKWDGTSCLVRDGKLYKRYDAKAFTVGEDGQRQPWNRQPPADFIAAQEPDAITGHWPGWVPVGNGPEDKWHRDIKVVMLGDGEAYEAKLSGTDHICWRSLMGNWYTLEDGTYELCGPRIQSNPDKFNCHTLVLHGCAVLDDCPRDFDGLKSYLAEHDIEGVVWWRGDSTDCDKVKIKTKDFGIKRGGK